MKQICTACRQGILKQKRYNDTSFVFTCTTCGYTEYRYISKGVSYEKFPYKNQRNRSSSKHNT